MTDIRNGHSTPLPLMAWHPQGASGTERTLLELHADVLTLVDETLIRTGSADNCRTVAPATRREDRLGQRLRRSVMFADAQKF